MEYEIFLIRRKNEVMKRLLTLLFLAFAFVGRSQTVLRFEALDQTTKDPISRLMIVPIVNGKYAEEFYTDLDGEAYLTVNNTDTVRFHFEHVAYEVKNAPETKVYDYKDTITIKLKLIWTRTRDLREVEIRAPGVPDTVYQSERLSVCDFEFLPNGKMLLLTYPKNYKRGTELLYYDPYTGPFEIPTKEKPLELVRDFRGNPHVVSEKDVMGITNYNEKIQLSHIDKAYYMSYIAPIVDSNTSRYFFSNYNSLYPAFDYFTYSFVDSSYRKIAQIEDEFMMELYRSEYKWVDIRTKIWAKEKEFETGIDAEVWVGATYFTQSIYYKEVYAPMFSRNDTVFVFDHYKNLMFRYDAKGDLMDSVSIYYHLRPKESGWKKLLLQDQVTGQIYIVYENAGKTTLQHFDSATGKLGEIIPLYFRYADNIIIRDNYIYYVYRPFESLQKKYLYKEKMAINYPEAITFRNQKPY